MTKPRYQKVIIVLLLLAFTGQSFAALMMPCQFGLHMSKTMNMDAMAGMDHADMAAMDHSSMGAADPTIPAEPEDCCKTMGHCSSSGCSLIFLGNSVEISMMSRQTDLNLIYTRVFPEILGTELFKPPILR